MTHKGYKLHITNTHNRWVLGEIRYMVSLNYSILGELIDLASYTVFGQLKVALSQTHTHNRWVLGENKGLCILNYCLLRELIDLALYYTVFGKPAVKRKMSTLPLTSRN